MLSLHQFFWTASGWIVHSSEETLFLDNMSAPWFILTGICIAFIERRLVWAHTRRSFASVQRRFETRPPWWFLTPRTCCLSILAHGVPVCPAGRIDRHDTLLAFLGSWCAGPTPLRAKDTARAQRTVCPRTAHNPCWKRLSWQPSFYAPCLRSHLALARGGPFNGPGLIHRPESPLHGWNPLIQDGSLDGWVAWVATGWVVCEVVPTEVPAKPLP